MTTLRLIRDDDGEPTLVDGIAGGRAAAQIAESIRSGTRTSDRSFDRFLPLDLRLVSSQHWTPLSVALRVGEWLNAARVRTVVDLGSGAGKFCVATALVTRCSFTGIEQRPRLIEAARALASRFGVDDRVRFVRGDLHSRTIPAADAYYLYNPFGENLFGSDDHVDDDVELSPERYARDVALVQRLFERAPEGTLVVKYNGFGGRMPPSYEEVCVDRELPNVLRMWRKVGPGAPPTERAP